MIHKGIVASATFPGIREDFAQFRQAVEDVVASGLFDGFEFYFSGSEQEQGRIGDMLEGAGLYGAYLPAFEMKRDGLDLGAKREADRQTAVERCRGFVRTAYRTRARKMLILSGPRPGGQFDIDAYLERFAQSMEEVLAYASGQAADYPLEVTLEFFNDVGEPWLAIGGAETVQRLCARMGGNHPGFGITFDTSHVAQLGEDLREDYTLLALHVHHLHLANCVVAPPTDALYGDRHPVFNLPGGLFTDGLMAAFHRWVETKPEFPGIDLCSFEVIPHGGMAPAECFRQVCASARAVWGG